MTGKKIVFLVLALILPVLIFIFLKIFGRNEFNVPIMHLEGKVDAPENCHYHYTTPYHISDSLSASLQINDNDSLYVLYFDSAENVQMKRISIAFQGAPVKVITPSDLFLLRMDVNVFKDCVLLIKPPNSIVLIDKQNRIRGYYDGAEPDEVDRLMVEIKIILKQY